jgi:putative DNA methylase
LEAHASDLNPVAVLITKALIEIPPKFAGQPPVNPAAKKKMSAPGMWVGARGLADDVRYYGKWMRDRAWERIGHLYPKVKLPKEHGGGEATVIAWLWARTVKCPNPACGAQMPLVRSFSLSIKQGKKAWLDPVIDHSKKTVRFEVKTGSGSPRQGTKLRGRSECLFCKNTISDASLRDQAKAFGIGSIPLAIVLEGPRDRVYVAAEQEGVSAKPVDTPWLNSPLPDNARWFSPPGYGISTFRDLFTSRQLLTLTTFSDLVSEACKQVIHDGGTEAYANALAIYLSFGIDKLTTTNSSFCSWQTEPTRLVAAFGRQAIPMVWDYAEANPLSGAAGDYALAVGSIAEVLDNLALGKQGTVLQRDACAGSDGKKVMFSTDPPYYDNIGYADLSDYFYVWLRRPLSRLYPDIFSTLLVPKKQELIASPHRFGGNKEEARAFFEEGFSWAFSHIRSGHDERLPLSVFYAFKQSESEVDEDGGGSSASTGWETMLEGLLKSGLQVTGTWPMRTELVVALKARVSALASSIVLACRPRPESAPITTRKDFLASLKRELPRALRDLQKGNVAPVDLAQAAIGPGMAVFSRYKRVLESDGTPMRVRTALALINQTLDEVLSEQESDFDPDTRWALAWFEQNQFSEGLYGQAEVLATAKAVAISGLVEAGIVHSRAGKVRLLRRNELSADWDPTADGRLTVWEVTQHLIHCLETRGETETAALKAKVGGLAETARELAYRLYTLCERKGWAEEAGFYNSLVVAWPAISNVPELFQQQ